MTQPQRKSYLATVTLRVYDTDPAAALVMAQDYMNEAAWAIEWEYVDGKATVEYVTEEGTADPGLPHILAEDVAP
jgi:hypothetical protein